MQRAALTTPPHGTMLSIGPDTHGCSRALRYHPSSRHIHLFGPCGASFRPGHAITSRRAQGGSRLAASSGGHPGGTPGLGLDATEHGGILCGPGTQCGRSGLVAAAALPETAAHRARPTEVAMMLRSGVAA